jgi:hypothetical protein
MRKILRRRSLGRLFLLATLLAVLALVSASELVPPAWAKPCCQSCQGWPDNPPSPMDSCWRTCIICGGGGHECGVYVTCDPGWTCINGYCERS